ncbi:MAG: hypothetical protein ACOCUU_00480 [Nanoarchaeota archaeon]
MSETLLKILKEHLQPSETTHEDSHKRILKTNLSKQSTLGDDKKRKVLERNPYWQCYQHSNGKPYIHIREDRKKTLAGRDIPNGLFLARFASSDTPCYLSYRERSSDIKIPYKKFQEKDSTRTSSFN